MPSIPEFQSANKQRAISNELSKEDMFGPNLSRNQLRMSEDDAVLERYIVENGKIDEEPSGKGQSKEMKAFLEMERKRRVEKKIEEQKKAIQARRTVKRILKETQNTREKERQTVMKLVKEREIQGKIMKNQN